MTINENYNPRWRLEYDVMAIEDLVYKFHMLPIIPGTITLVL